MSSRYGNDALISGYLDKVGKLRTRRRGYYELVGSILYKSKRKSKDEIEWEIDICDGVVEPRGRNGLSISFSDGPALLFYTKNSESWQRWLASFEIAVQRKVENFYDIHEMVGEGGFAKVFRGTNRQTGALVAVKTIDKGASAEKFLSREGASQDTLHLLESDSKSVVLI